MDKEKQKSARRTRRKRHIRRRVHGTASRPRLTVFRSNKHIYGQLVDDSAGVTIAAASTRSKEAAEAIATKTGGDRKAAAVVGGLLAERAKAAGVVAAVFDRNGYKFHGRVKELAEAARKAGLSF